MPIRDVCMYPTPRIRRRVSKRFTSDLDSRLGLAQFWLDLDLVFGPFILTITDCLHKKLELPR